MRRFLHSRTFFYTIATTLCVGTGVAWLCDSEWRFSPAVPVLYGGMAVILLLVGGLTLSHVRNHDPLPRAHILWRVLVFSLVCNIACNLYFFSNLMHAPFSLFLAAACICWLWVILGRLSMIICCPFFILQLAQIAGSLQYGARINSLVIAETLEASEEEIFGYLSASNMLIALASVAGGVLLSWTLVRILRSQRNRLQLVNAGLLFALIAGLFSLTIPPVRRDPNYYWPVYEVYALIQSWSEALFHNQATIKQAQSLPSPAEQPSSLHTLHGGEGVVLVVHIGESVRADRMGINGYSRDTTPFLSSCTNLINFPNCISAACDTCQAQIAILTDARRNIYEKDPAMQPHTGSVLDLFAAHGFRVCSFFGKRNATHLKYDMVVRILTRCAAERHHSPGSPWTAVPLMAESLRDQSAGQNTVLFINNEGSHTPFFHYDHQSAPFLPAGSSFENPAAHAQSVNNAYDNTVHYTDEFVRRVTRILQGRPWLYLYISDHGEYLGHDGIWGRAALGESGRDYHSTTGCRVGMFFLYSPEFEKVHPHFADALRILQSHTSMTVAQEHIFHTILGIFDLQTPWYNPSLDLSSTKAQPYSGPQPQFSR